MKIGYSFWGFLGAGVVDTPDGGRGHRRTLIDGLIADGHEVVFLQSNRDLEEANLDLQDHYRWAHTLPDLDALFLEWRWPIPGRNTTRCGDAGHTCDLHRQDELLEHYTMRRATPTLLWDKDRQLSSGHPWRVRGNVALCEAALHPSPGAMSLLFPIADDRLNAADPKALASLPRPLPLLYVGNQYDRDDAFDRYFGPAAGHIQHRVVGKWARTSRWPNVNFTGRCGFEEVEELYSQSLATVLLLPGRYAQAAQMTQRIFEAVLSGCLPLTPTSTRASDRFTPVALHVADGDDVIDAVGWLSTIAGTDEHADLIAACLQRLSLFRLSAQLATINRVLVGLTHQSAPVTAAT